MLVVSFGRTETCSTRNESAGRAMESRVRVQGDTARRRGVASCSTLPSSLECHLEQIEPPSRRLHDVERGIDQPRVEEMALQPNHGRALDGAECRRIDGLARTARLIAVLVALKGLP